MVSGIWGLVNVTMYLVSGIWYIAFCVLSCILYLENECWKNVIISKRRKVPWKFIDLQKSFENYFSLYYLISLVSILQSLPYKTGYHKHLDYLPLRSVVDLQICTRFYQGSLKYVCRFVNYFFYFCDSKIVSASLYNIKYQGSIKSACRLRK